MPVFIIYFLFLRVRGKYTLVFRTSLTDFD